MKKNFIVTVFVLHVFMFLTTAGHAGNGFDITQSIADNPAVQIFSQNADAKLDNWFPNAKDHWKVRSGNSWKNYIQQLTSPNPSLNPPSPPQPPCKKQWSM